MKQQNKKLNILRYICIMSVFVFGLITIVGSGGGGGDGTTTPTSFTVGGTVDGLNGTVILKNNATDELSISTDGDFTFGTKLANGASYSVIVSSNPAGQTCSVAKGTGAISSANVTDVAVTCIDGTYSVGGTISGLTGDGLVLKNNGTDDLSVTPPATDFEFATLLPDGASYSVTVSSQPTGQTCMVSKDSGVISGADISTVTVTCIDGVYRLIQVQKDTDYDTNPGIDEVETYTYDDSSGNRMTYSYDANNNGVVDVTYEYTYNNNYLESYTEDEDGSDDAHKYTLFTSGNAAGLPSEDNCDKDASVHVESDYTISYVFDTNGYPASLAFENSTVTSIQFYMWGNNFDCHANKSQSENWNAFKFLKLDKQIEDLTRWLPFDPIPNFDFIFSYDANCNLSYYKYTEGSKNIVKSYDYDVNGYLSRVETDNNNDGVADKVEDYEYENGNRTKRKTDSDANGSYDEVRTYTYTNGKMTTKEIENDGNPAAAEYTENLTYDPITGFLEKREIDTNGDGNVNYVITYIWDDITI